MNGPKLLGTFSSYDTTHFSEIQWGFHQLVWGTVNWATGYVRLSDLSGVLATNYASYGQPSSIELAIDCDRPCEDSGHITAHLFVDGSLDLSASTAHPEVWQGKLYTRLQMRQPGFASSPSYYIAANIDSGQLAGWPGWSAQTRIDAARAVYNAYPTAHTGLSSGFLGTSFDVCAANRAYIREPLSGAEWLLRAYGTNSSYKWWRRLGPGAWSAHLGTTMTELQLSSVGDYVSPVGFAHNGLSMVAGQLVTTSMTGVVTENGGAEISEDADDGWQAKYAITDDVTDPPPISSIWYDPLSESGVAVGYDFSSDRERIFTIRTGDTAVNVVADTVRSSGDVTCIPWPFILRRPDGQYEVGCFVNQQYKAWLSNDGASWSAETPQSLSDVYADMVTPQVAVGLDGLQVVAGWYMSTAAASSVYLVAWWRKGFGETWQRTGTVATVAAGTMPYVRQLPDGVWEIGWQVSEDETAAPTRYQADHPGGTWSAA